MPDWSLRLTRPRSVLLTRLQLTPTLSPPKPMFPHFFFPKSTRKRSATPSRANKRSQSKISFRHFRAIKARWFMFPRTSHSSPDFSPSIPNTIVTASRPNNHALFLPEVHQRSPFARKGNSSVSEDLTHSCLLFGHGSRRLGCLADGQLQLISEGH